MVGAGFGGLALAIRLQSAGKKTLLIEKRDKPGGRAYVYEQDGYKFDAGPTVITDPAALEELWALSGRKLSEYVTLMPVDPFYRLMWEDGSILDYSDDQKKMDAQISDFAPADVDGYRRFLAYSQDLYHEGYEKLGAVPFLHFRQMIMAAPQLVRLQSYRSVYSKVASFISDDKLRQAFSFHSLLVGGNPFTASAIYALIHALERKGGVWFAKGGTGALVDGMVRLFEDMGGETILGTSVSKFLTDGDRIRGVEAGGKTYMSDSVASNADIVHNYERLLGETAHGSAVADRMKRYSYSMSLFVIYFGLKGGPEDLKHHVVLFGNRYRELISEIFSGPDLPEDFSLYLHCPTVSDDSLAPEGCSAYYVLSPVPHLGNAAIDWETAGPIYRDKILAYLEKQCIPNLSERLVTSRIFTPSDFQTELNSHLGSAFSVEPRLTQSAWFRPHNQDSKFKNLFFVGAGTHPGAGIPGVVASAKATASIMLQDEPA